MEEEGGFVTVKRRNKKKHHQDIKIEERAQDLKLKLCLTCQKFGHKQCLDKIVCKFCQGSHLSKNCKNKTRPSCFHCSGSHRTGNEKCGLLIIAQKIEQLRYDEEISKDQYKNLNILLNDLVASQKPSFQSNQKQRAIKFDLTSPSSSSYTKNISLKFYNGHNNTSEIRIFKEISETFYNGYCSIFTDGSKSQKGVGSSVFVSNLPIVFNWRLNDNCTILESEKYAILEALRWISSNISGRNCVIYSDCKNALSEIKGRTDSSGCHLVKKIQGLMSRISMKGVQVYIQWIPAHKSIIGNENADSYAKIATSKEVISPMKNP